MRFIIDRNILSIHLKKDGILFEFIWGHIYQKFPDWYYVCKLCNKKTNIRKQFPINRILCPDCSAQYPNERIEEVRQILKPYSSTSGFNMPLEKMDNFWYIRDFVD